MTDHENNIPKILIVDDKPENLVVLEQILLHLDVQLIKAYSGNEALAYSLEHNFMLAILDVQMPGMDGYEVLEVMSWDERTKHIPVIFITANMADESHRLKGYLGGAVDYLAKPINDQILICKVKVFLELYRQRQQIQQLQERYQSILETAGEGIFGLDTQGKITFANPAVMSLLGWQIDKITGKHIDTLLPKHNSSQHIFNWHETELFRECAQGNIVKETDAYFIRQDGTALPIKYTATPIHDNHQKLKGIVIVFSDITLYKNAQAQLNELAHHDHLTDLPNRLLFEKTLNKEIARCRRHQKIIGLLYCDLDDFKDINDNYGHDIGDALLQSFAGRIRRCVRENDTVARVGGDEFAIILDTMNASDDAMIVAQKMLDALTTPFSIQQHVITCHVSIGIATFPDTSNDAVSLMKHADKAMYSAKHQGGQQYCFYTANCDNDDALSLANVENEIRHAIESESLFCVYEPRFSASNESVISFDVTLNWEHPTLGRLTADQFLPLIEDRYIMQLIDKWVVEQVATQHQQWRQDNFPVTKISFSISSIDFLENDFVDFMQALFNTQKIHAADLEVKIAEDRLAKCEKYITILESIKKIGIALMIDNFGSGPQSLILLRTGLLDRIAIAKQFIHGCANHAADEAIVHSIIYLAHELGIKILAKCVENDAQWLFLKNHGCDEYFGYYFAKPLIAKEIVHFLRTEESLSTQLAK